MPAISNLPTVTLFTGTMIFPLVDVDGTPDVTKKASFDQLRNYLLYEVTVSSVAGKIGDVTLEWSDISGLATVSTSGSYTDLINLPTPYSLTSATSSALGGVKIGSGININAGGTISVTPYSLTSATSSALGGVKIGAGLAITNDGTISVSASTPPATTSTLGAVIIGNGIDVAVGGTISVTPYSLPTASTSTLGGVKVDGETITITDGVISGANTYSLPTASTSTLGGIKIGSGLAIDGSGVVSAAPNGTGLAGRTSVSVTTDSISAGASANVTITGFKGYALLSIETSNAAWVSVYSSTAARLSDSARAITSDPNPGSGVIAEVITTGSATQYFSPAVIGYSSESNPSTDIPIKVYNNGAGSAAITVTLTLIQLEA